MSEQDERTRWIAVASALPARSRLDAHATLDVAAAEQRERARRAGARLILAGERDYPAALKPVPAPPLFLLVRGEIRADDAFALAIVGSRHPTPYGLAVTERLAAELAARGVTIVSGFARGIDTAAHRGALAAGGRTIAVLGSGVEVVYPPENRALVPQVLEHGALVSQFPMTTPALAMNFPSRNRTIAALALGTLVVEAAERSGALLTAGYAGELGREVFAVPGPVTSAVSRGTNGLIQDGAKLVQGWEDVVAELPEAWRRCLREPAVVPAADALEADEARLLGLVGAEAVHIDRLIEQSGVASGRMAALLLALELKGCVRQLPGQRYMKLEGARAQRI